MMTDERFARHQGVPGWNQESLARATVAILGVGGLGNGVAQILAQAGVGRLILCDPDIVEASNLSRTPLFRPEHIGIAKVDAAAQTLAGLAPGIELSCRRAALVSGVGLAELRDADLAIGCLDSRAARVRLAGRCSLVRAGWIDAGTSAWGGEVRPYLDPDGPCYGCSPSAAERSIRDQALSCADLATAATAGAGAHAATSSLVASFTAMLALRALMSLPVAAQTIRIDGERGQALLIDEARDPECPFHDPLDPIVPDRRLPLSHRATVAELKQLTEAIEDIEPGARILLWQPVMRGARCLACGHRDDSWGAVGPRPCPRCDRPLQPRTTTSLGGAPPTLRLCDLAVAPREILAIETARGISAIELAGPDSKGVNHPS